MAEPAPNSYAHGCCLSICPSITEFEEDPFALRLSEAGMAMNPIAVALGTSRPHVVTMIGVARELPLDLVMAIGRAPALGEPRWDKLRRLYAEAKLARGQKGVEREWLRAVQEPVFVSMEALARMEAVSEVFRTTDGGPAVEAAPRVEAREIIDGQQRGRLSARAGMPLDVMALGEFFNFVLWSSVQCCPSWR